MTPIRIDPSWYEKPEGIPEHVCAGGLVMRLDGDRILIALCRQKGYDDFIIPKGHVEEGEDQETAARREIEEEAGFTDLTLLSELGVRDRLDFRKEAWKRTHYFLYLTEQRIGRPTHGHMHPPPVWHALDELPPLFWPEQQELVDAHRDQIRQAGLDRMGPVLPATS